MNKQICIIIFLLTCRICNAQNLVPNPSFEVHDTCPYNTMQVPFALGWYNCGNTPDYFNACATLAAVSVPTNAVGNQYAATGQAYCGLFGYYASDYREFITATLDSSLQIGQKYYVSAKFSLADGSSFNNAVKQLCIRFSMNSFTQNFPAPVDNFAQIISDTLITDTIGWYLVKGSFIADSAYNHIIVGNFFDNLHTDTFNLDLNSTGYYYVDDVCVSTDSLNCYSTVGINEVNNDNEVILFPNPFTDKINITANRNELLEVSLYDVTSRKIFNQLFTNSTSINTEQLAKGIYLYEVRNKNGVIKKGKVVKY